MKKCKNHIFKFFNKKKTFFEQFWACFANFGKKRNFSEKSVHTIFGVRYYRAKFQKNW